MGQKTTSKIGVGLIGSQFISTIHAEALKTVQDAQIIAAMSPTEEHITAFCKQHDIPNCFTDLDKLLAMDEIDMVVIGAPNNVHCEITVKAAEAGKHVVVEKPFCLNLAEADQMIEACRKANVKLMYAEELCFTPKYVRLKELLDEGALGKPTLFKQSEKHDGPHADHFWDVERSGGGVTMDMTISRNQCGKHWKLLAIHRHWKPLIFKFRIMITLSFWVLRRLPLKCWMMSESNYSPFLWLNSQLMIYSSSYVCSQAK